MWGSRHESDQIVRLTGSVRKTDVFRCHGGCPKRPILNEIADPLIVGRVDGQANCPCSTAVLPNRTVSSLSCRHPYVAEEETTENRIVPDAAFILDNIETGKRAFFFVEMDMATERIISTIAKDTRSTLHHKISQYDRYLTGGRFAKTYAPFGDFRYFMLLFVTLGDERIENIRKAAGDLSGALHDYYRLTTFAEAIDDFFGEHWRSRSLIDGKRYMLVRV